MICRYCNKLVKTLMSEHIKHKHPEHWPLAWEKVGSDDE